MLVDKKSYGFSSNKKYIEGQGFVDTMSSAFRSVVTALKSVGSTITSYMSENKDLITKPVLGAIGALAATGLTVGVPTLISHIVNRNKGKNRPPSGPLVSPISSGSMVVPQDSALFHSLESSPEKEIPEKEKYKEILNNLMHAIARSPTPPVTSIIGSGLKNF
jgi:hypothetical protein